MKYTYTTMPKEWVEKHTQKLYEHINAVVEAGKQLGVPMDQLAHHDDSKYSDEEFLAYAQQFYGDKSDPNGFAMAWLHHLHANKHHWQHWIFPDEYMLKGSSIEEGGLVEMPENYALEMIADWQGASFCYTGSWNMRDWLRKNSRNIILHSKTALYVRKILSDLGYENTLFYGDAE